MKWSTIHVIGLQKKRRETMGRISIWRDHSWELSKFPEGHQIDPRSSGNPKWINAKKAAAAAAAKSLQSCPTLHDPMDCSLPGSSIHGIFQARVLEWGAIAFSGKESYTWVYHSQTVEDQRKEKILKATKQRIWVTKMEKHLLLETIDARRQWTNFFKVLEKETCYLISLYISFTLSF